MHGMAQAKGEPTKRKARRDQHGREQSQAAETGDKHGERGAEAEKRSV